jgi:ATP-binding cassette subfamily B protein
MSSSIVDEVIVAGRPRLQSDARALLRDLLRPHRWAVVGVLLAVALQIAFTMAAPWLIGVAIDTSLPQATRGNYTSVIQVTVALVVCALASAWLRAVFVRWTGRIGQDILLDLRRRTFDHTQALSVSFHERFTSGRVISRMTSDVDTLNELLDSGLDGLLTATLTIVAIAVVLLVLDLPLALLALASFLPLWFLFRWFSSRAAEAFRLTRESVARLIVNIVETFNGIRAVQAFSRERANDETFGRLNDEYREANATAFRLHAVFIPGTSLIGSITVVAVLLVGGYRVTEGGLALGVLTAFVLYLRQFFDPMEDVAVFYNSLQSATAALEKISAVLAEPVSVPGPTSPVPLEQPVRGAVSLREVEFGYREEQPILHRLSLDIPAGQTVALVGATGAGKSTIAKLIARFYDPSTGSVQLDGIDLRQLGESELRRSIVMVTQDGFMFSGSVADNIAFGRPDATRDEIIAAAQAVGADPFIQALPEDYDTDVRKRGGRLSAGQRQLVAFARAFLADPSVLILDEATSSLDGPTERAVQRALRTVLRDRTALIIAHRLSTVDIADRVLVLDAGQFAALHDSWRTSLS